MEKKQGSACIDDTFSHVAPQAFSPAMVQNVKQRVPVHTYKCALCLSVWACIDHCRVMFY